MNMAPMDLDVNILGEQLRSTKSQRRAYRMTNRADQVDRTRDRIIEATVELHGSLGPAHTTVSAIAQAAGVTRLTVYRHFPDNDALFAACTTHWAAQQRMPDLDAWRELPDPTARLRFALTDLYRFFGEAEQMLTRSSRDWDDLPEFVRTISREREQARIDAILSAWPRHQRTATRRGLIGHATAFRTWRSLCIEQGLSPNTAAAAMVRMLG